jgi:hypothetical protein
MEALSGEAVQGCCPALGSWAFETFEMPLSGVTELIAILALVAAIWATGALWIVLFDRVAARQLSRRRAAVRSHLTAQPARADQ